ncbi:hypothetical protein AAE485_04260 [Acidithiobacillus ferriphilus]|uniref:hypothetical protein n=1 Tax=Acidithiobacillus ferriphilus TaxID=1689834 RepID=UPI00390C904B
MTIEHFGDYKLPSTIISLEDLPEKGDLIDKIDKNKKQLWFNSESSELNYYSSLFLHKNHEMAFNMYPSFKSEIADPIADRDKNHARKVLNRGKKAWPWTVRSIPFWSGFGTRERDNKHSVILGARSPMAHLALIYAISSGEIIYSYFTIEDEKLVISLKDKFGIIKLKVRERESAKDVFNMAREKNVVSIALPTTLSGHFLMSKAKESSVTPIIEHAMSIDLKHNREIEKGSYKKNRTKSKTMVFSNVSLEERNLGCHYDSLNDRLQKFA